MEAFSCFRLLLETFCLVNVIAYGVSEPFSSNRGNIVPVKLYHISPKNSSTSYLSTKDDLPYGPGGSLATISRVVPLKNFGNAETFNFFDFKPSKGNNVTSTLPKVQTFFLPSKRNSSKIKSKFRNKPFYSQIKIKNNSPKVISISTTRKPETTFSTTTIVSGATEKVFNASDKTTNATIKPSFLSENSWQFLKSLIPIHELYRIIDSVSDEVIQNLTRLAQLDPILGENYIINNIIETMEGTTKPKAFSPRMLEIDTVNTGIRFNTKMKPVLNIIPLENQNHLSSIASININRTASDQRKLSGHIKNEAEETDYRESNEMMANYYKREGDETDNIIADQSFLSFRKASRGRNRGRPRHRPSTTPSLLKVLPIPDPGKLETTPTPFSPSPPINGFIPLMPTAAKVNEAKLSDNLSVVSSTVLASVIEEASSSLEVFPTSESPKAFEHSNEIEYQIPSITTSSTVEPEVIKGYQTIPESTTTGPKIIWYQHNQTPEDTFYPNFDNFLVPPDESSIEISENGTFLVDSSKSRDPSLSSYSNDAGTLVASTYGKNVKHESYSYDSNSYSGNKSSTNGRGRTRSIGIQKASHLPSYSPSTKQRMKDVKTNLLPSATIIDHDGIQEIYEDEFTKNGAGDSKRYKQKYPPPSQQKESGRYAYSSNENSPGSHKPYDEDNILNYNRFAEVEDHHYHDSYPPSNKHEISSLHTNNREHPLRPSNGNSNYYRDRDESESPRPPSSLSPYRGGGEIDVSSLDYYGKNKPLPEPENFKDRYPGHRHQGHSSHHHHGYGSHHHGYHGHKDPKTFFSFAKEYFKNSDFSTASKWFDVSIGILAFLAFGGYVIMLLYQVFTVSTGTTLGAAFGKSFRGAGELFDLFFSKGPLGQAYIDELEAVVKRAMANVKRSWVTNSFAQPDYPLNVKGEVNKKRK